MVSFVNIGAANRLMEYQIVPSVIIGDMDSIQKQTLNYYTEKVNSL
jgi:thiamine pyrophosphokinase